MKEARLVAGSLCAVAFVLLAAALRLRLPAGMAPIVVLVPTSVVLVVEAVLVWRGHEPPGDGLAGRVTKARQIAGSSMDSPRRHRRELMFVAWLAMLAAACLLFGVGIALPIFLLFWLRFQARRGWTAALLTALPAMLLLVWLLPWSVGLRLPAGVVGPTLLR